MSARFRLVHFVPDPFTGVRFPLAALVRVDGETAVARSPAGPDMGLGQVSPTQATARFILETLETARDYMQLPMSLGPHAVLGEERQIPEGVTSPVSWVEETLLRPAARSVLVRAHSTLTPSREEVGFRFLEQWNVAKFVGRSFRPREHFPRLPAASILPDVSQYVRGSSRLLLMEPVVADRRGARKSIKHVGTTFLALQRALEQTSLAPKVEYVAYLVSSVDEDRAEEARNTLKSVATQVIDVNDSDQRTTFLGDIRRTGESFLH